MGLWVGSVSLVRVRYLSFSGPSKTRSVLDLYVPLMALCSFALSSGRSLSTRSSSMSSRGSFSYRTSNAMAAIRAWSRVKLMGAGISSSSSFFARGTTRELRCAETRRANDACVRPTRMNAGVQTATANILTRGGKRLLVWLAGEATRGEISRVRNQRQQSENRDLILSHRQ